MKNFKQVIPFALVAACGPLLSAQADILTQWTFETSVPTTAGPISPEVGSGSAIGSHASGSAVYSSPTGNGSLKAFSSNFWGVNDYYQFQTSTVGYTGVSVTYDQISSATGPGSFAFGYSTDGLNFTYLSNYSVLANAAPNTWSNSVHSAASSYSVDLSTLTSLNGATAVYFRLTDTATTTPSGGTVGTAGTDRVDNFTISAQPVPEPASIALSVIGGLALLVVRNRRA